MADGVIEGCVRDDDEDDHDEEVAVVLQRCGGFSMPIRQWSMDLLL